MEAKSASQMFTAGQDVHAAAGKISYIRNIDNDPDCTSAHLRDASTAAKKLWFCVQCQSNFMVHLEELFTGNVTSPG